MALTSEYMMLRAQLEAEEGAMVEEDLYQVDQVAHLQALLLQKLIFLKEVEDNMLQL